MVDANTDRLSQTMTRHSTPLLSSVDYPDSPLVPSLWAECLKKAHYNAIGNLACVAVGWGGIICIAWQVLQ